MFIFFKFVLTEQVVEKQRKISGKNGILKIFLERILNRLNVQSAPTCAEAGTSHPKRGLCSCSTKHLIHETALQEFN